MKRARALIGVSFLVAAFLIPLIPHSARADYVEIGTPAATWFEPLGTLVHDSRTQIIYLSSELGGPSTIVGLALNVLTPPGQTMNNFTIRIKHTDLSVFDTASFDGPASGWTTVYQNNETVNSTGWVEFMFQQPFYYNGSANIILDISFDNSSGSSDGVCFRFAPGGYRTIYARSDSGYGDPLLWDGATDPVPLLSTRTPQIRFLLSGDTDGDGLSDTWEDSFSCMQANTVDNTADYDSDALDNQGEFLAGADPCNPDSDGGGDKDGNEIAHSRDPRNPADDDADNDGLLNSYENMFLCLQANTADNLVDYDFDDLNNDTEHLAGTDPCDPDTDGGGEQDGREISYSRDPLDGYDDDPDDDGMPAGWETAYPCMQNTVADASADYDADELDNISEFLLGSDPCDYDSDGDSLPDGWEFDHEGCGFDALSFVSEYTVQEKLGTDTMVTSDPGWDPSFVWTGSEYGVSFEAYSGELGFARLDAQGNTIGGFSELTANDYYNQYPAIVWTGSEYGVCWRPRYDSGGSNEIYFARLDAQGEMIGGKLQITSASNSDSTSSSLVWTGSQFAMAWSADHRDSIYELYLALVDAHGIRTSPNLQLTSNADPDSPSMVWTGSELAMCWRDGRNGVAEIYFARFDSAGGRIGEDSRLTYNGTVDRDKPSLVWTGSEFGVSWVNTMPNGMEDIYFTRLDAGGVRIGGEINVSNDGHNSWSPSLAWTGSLFGVSWQDSYSGSAIYTAWLDDGGAKLGGNFLVTPQRFSFTGTPHLLWTGSEFGLAFKGGANAQIIFSRLAAYQYTSKDGDDLPEDLEFALGTDPCSPDTDNDGMPDDWEAKYLPCGLNPLGDDAINDPDRDLLNNIEEYSYSTDPCVVDDRDGDGLADGEEVHVYLTDPTYPDTDGDGASDGVEVNVYRTDPLIPDTDGDLMSDGWEINEGAGCGLQPLTADGSADSDGDGLSNLREFILGALPCVIDTDEDGMPDGWEEENACLDPLGINLTFTGAYTGNGLADSIVVAGGYAYLVNYNLGLQIVDISDPSHPVAAGNYGPLSNATSVYVAGHYAYMTTFYGGLYIIDVSNPSAPGLAGHVDTPSYAFDVFVAGDYAYIADGYAGLVIIDVSNPQYPTLVGTLDTTHYAYSVYVQGEFAYLLEMLGGMRIINVSDPASPVLVGTYSAKIVLNSDLIVSGNYVYVVYDLVGLQIVDVSNPATPVKVGGYFLGARAGEIALSGGYAWVANDSTGLDIINISNPSNPALVETYSLPTPPGGIFISGNRVYAASGNYALNILTVNDSDLDGFSDPQEYSAGSDPCKPDSDGDLFADNIDCGPTNQDVFPGAPELCDEIDNQCPGDPGYGIPDENCTDTDGDGMADAWENLYTSCGLDPMTGDSLGDPDGDLFTNLEEYQVFSDPCVATDRDGDGLTDGEEVHLYLTDPLDTDTDNDTLSDYEEVNLGVDGYITNPLLADTDGDGMPDNWEDSYLACGLNPTANNSSGDPDSDLFTNLEEFTAGTNPCVSTDRDGDGLTDGEEVHVYLTDPLDADTDNDTLSDLEEVTAGADGFITDPLDTDTDNDGFPDNLDPDPLNPLIGAASVSVAIQAPADAPSIETVSVTYRVLNQLGALNAADNSTSFTATVTGTGVFAGTASQGQVISGGGTNAALVRVTGGEVVIGVSVSGPGTVCVGAVDSETVGLSMPSCVNIEFFDATVTLGGGTVMFTRVEDEPAVDTNMALAVGRFDADGYDDVVVTSFTSTGAMAVIPGRADGTFGAMYASVNTTGKVFAIVAGDFNEDGCLDVALGDYDNSLLEIWSGNCAGAFSQLQTYSAASPTGIASADLNHDGHLDLGVVTSNASNAQIFLGNGTGVFTGPTAFAVGTTAREIDFGDLNNDGNLDMVIAGWNNKVATALGNGAGSFGMYSTFTAGTNTSAVKVGEFTGDNCKDVAAANYGSNNVMILSGNCLGGLTLLSTLSTGAQPHSLVVHDFNLDGLLDLSTSNRGGNVTVYQGSGGGNFTGQVNYTVASQSYDLVAGDFNGDGLTDIAAAADSVDKVTLLKNITPLADLDGDGLNLRAENWYGTSPTDADSDDDGLTDGVEVFTTRTDPTDPDTDNDSSNDGADCEPLNASVYPAAPELCDSIDNQCLGDTGYGTVDEGCNPDLDGDGLLNTEESAIGTNPLLWDSDGDGMSDYLEHNAAGLDPLLAGDGMGDLDADLNPNVHEVYNGTDMNDPDPEGHFSSTELGCCYFADADGDGVLGPNDIAGLENDILGLGADYSEVIPPTGLTMDADGDGGIGPGDLSEANNMLLGLPLAYIGGRADSLVVLDSPAGPVAAGDTCRVTIGVRNEADLGYTQGFAVIFEVVSGDAAILGGDGSASTAAPGNRYDFSGAAGSSSIVVRPNSSGAITIDAFIPSCGTPGVGRSCAEIGLASPVNIVSP